MKNKQPVFLFILIISVSLLVFQYMIYILSGSGQGNFLTRFFFNLPVNIIIGLIDFLVINTVYNKFRYKHKTYVRISIDLVLTALSAILLSVVANYFLSFIFSGQFESGQNVIGTIQSSLPLVLWNVIIVLLIEIFFYNQRQIEAEKRIALIEKEKIQYQYETLKAQINPHFLFNSLNVLSSLAYEDAEKANLFAKKMSGIYRYLLLTNTRLTVTLKEELAFLDSYIFLEQIRFENALFVEINNDGAYSNKEIIPVSLQLLVENAVKHNITTSERPLTIIINVTKQGITVSNNLQLRSSVDKGGVGLENLRNQYGLCGKVIEVIETECDFTVKIPFIE